MPARKNRPGKHGTDTTVCPKSPKDQISAWAAQTGAKVYNQIGARAFEVQCRGTFCLLACNLQGKWAATHNAIPREDETDRYRFTSPNEAFHWYEQLHG